MAHTFSPGIDKERKENVSFNIMSTKTAQTYIARPCNGLRYSFQHPHSSSQSSVTPGPGSYTYYWP